VLKLFRSQLFQQRRDLEVSRFENAADSPVRATLQHSGSRRSCTV
jgi:hypothetical protein